MYADIYKDMKEYRKSDNFISRNKGFTLVEMIVVITIIAIICGLAVAGLLTYQDWAQFKKENEYARTLFVAAQNQLSEYSANGRLDDMCQDLLVEAGEETNGLPIYAAAPGVETVNVDSIVADEDLSSVWNGTSEGVVVALSADAGDYEAYLTSPDSCDRSIFWLYEILGPYVYDAGILENGAVRLEITPEDGQVFAILYTDKNSSFDSIDTNLRREADRRENMVGYYGVESLSKANKNPKSKTNIELSKVRLYNKETLYLSFKVKDLDIYNTADAEAAYTVTLLDKDKTTELLTLEIKGILRGEQQADTRLNEITCQAIRHDSTGDVDLGEVPILAWRETDGDTVHVVLDAMDLEATAHLYNSAYDNIHSKTGSNTTEAKAWGDSFRDTYSFFRFGLDSQNVFATVKVSAKGYKTSVVRKNFPAQTAKNTCFAGEKNDEYSLRNLRHLSNIRYIETTKAYEDRTGAVAFKLNGDLDWSEFLNDGEKANVYDSSYEKSKKLAGEAPANYLTARYECEFPSLPQLMAKDTFKGNDKEITSLSITHKANEVYDAYKKSAGNKEIQPAGLFNVNYGTVENLTLDKITVSGKENVGGFIGVNAGKVNNLVMENSDELSSISGSKNVGGLIGMQLPANDFLESFKAYDGVKAQYVTDNYMVISGLTNRAAVYGVEAVGGIAGALRNDFSFLKDDISDLEGLSNVDATKLVDARSVYNLAISECRNYGQVLGIYKTNADAWNLKYQPASVKREIRKNTYTGEQTESRYIGGIVGYTYNAKENATYRISISKCTSSPQYKDEVLAKMRDDAIKEETGLKGVYVGGIVGLNYYGQIDTCSTAPEKNTKGYIFGNTYVGGIVGLNIGPTSGIVGTATGTEGTNENNVLAYEYAGGIVGCNAKMSEVDSAGATITSMDPDSLENILVPDTETYLNAKVDNWINKGVVVAINRYAGGITGYNTGWVYRCNSIVTQKDSEAGIIEGMYSGSYVGGIVGYNNGIVGNSERKITGNGKKSVKDLGSNGIFPTTCYVKGTDYVGGIVGYNDVDAIIEDYQVKGGYVIGGKKGCFVGGYAGFNSAIDLLMDMSNKPVARKILSNANRIEGGNFVGGVIGGNIINMQDLKGVETIEGVFKTDNFLGTMEGEAFIGGFVGYNCVINDGPKSALVTGSADSNSATYIVQDAIVSQFRTINEDEGLSTEEMLAAKKKVLDELKTELGFTPYEKKNKGKGNKNKSEKIYGIHIKGESASEEAKSNMGSITGKIYVGGVIGYNDEHAVCYVENVENATPVIATEAIRYADEQYIIKPEEPDKKIYRTTDYAGRNFTYTYSYAGGIMGKVSKSTVIDHCYNSTMGRVETRGTYTGGLCEINEGIIINCDVTTYGSGAIDYLGGLCGLNKGGTITECRMNKKTVSGRNVVGAIAAENFGTISEIELVEPRMIVEGKDYTDEAKKVRDGVTGLFAGVNGSTGVIEIGVDIENVNIRSGGRFVGAITGVNEGEIKDIKKDVALAKDEKNADKCLTVTGTVTGYQAVGGFIGRNNDENESREVNYYLNKATVTATNGNAGGIIGENESKNTIRYCYNDGIVVATDEGNAGGITSSNSGIINQCFDYGTVTAPKGMCGGIVSVNKLDGRIELCSVKPRSSGKLTFISAKAVGAVAAQNYGNIYNNTIRDVVVTNYTGTLNTNIGIVAGENLSTGVITMPLNSTIINTVAIAETNNCNVGGVAGYNDGTIRGENSTFRSLVEPNLQLGKAKYASLGGVSGRNTGVIDNIAVDTHIEGNLGAATIGYGGISGVSGYLTSEEWSASKQEKKAAYSALITNCSFDGKIHATGSSGAPAFIGGVVGLNGYGSKIENSYIGVRTDNGLTQIMAGDEAKMELVKNGADTNRFNNSDSVSFTHMGGIVGDNYGWISTTDNATQSRDRVEIVGFGGNLGGIVGYLEKYAIISGESETNRISTGKNWSVISYRTENDHGPGGVIGFSASGEDISHVDNWAYVESVFPNNNKVGGIVANIEQKYKHEIKFEDVNNYGDVIGTGRVGGMAGIIRAAGASFTNCNNYGKINSLYRDAAGFVSTHSYFNASQGMKFYNCANHGNIANVDGAKYRSYTYTIQKEWRAAGFLGYTEAPDANAQIYFYNCVNTGSIMVERPFSADQVGSFIASSGCNAVFDTCRNYNNFERYKTTTACGANGFVGTGGKATFINCLDDSGNETSSKTVSPYGGTVTSIENSYYISDMSTFSMDNADYGVYFSFYMKDNNDPKFNEINYTKNRNNGIYFLEPMENRAIKDMGDVFINLDYSDGSQGIDALEVFFWNGKIGTENDNKTAIRANSVTATYYYSDGTTQQTTEENINGAFYRQDSMVKLVNPKADKKPVKILLDFSNTAYLRGFGYVPTQTGKDTVCQYAGKQYNTTFDVYNINILNSTGNKTKLATFDASGFTRKVPNDVLAADMGQFGNFRISSTGTLTDDNKLSNGEWAEIEFAVDNRTDAEVIDKFVFYLTNDAGGTTSSNKTIHYSYNVTFIDENGVEKSTAMVEDAIGYDGSVDNYKELSKQEVSIPSGLTGKVRYIKLNIRQTFYYEGAATTKKVNNGGVYFRGVGFIPVGETRVHKMAAGIGSGATDVAPELNNNTKKITPLYVDASGAKTHVYSSINPEIGFDMTYAVNNPASATYFDDDTNEYGSYLATNTVTKPTNNRADTYLDLDPKFTEMIKKSYVSKVRLATPSNIVLSKNMGTYHVTWNPVPNAYQYQIYYVVSKNDPTNESVPYEEIERSPVTVTGSGACYFDAQLKDEWVDESDYITFYIVAVNAYHIMNPDEPDAADYDSLPGRAGEILKKKTLIQPQVHLEMIPGDQTLLVLDNYDEYVSAGITKDVEIVYELKSTETFTYRMNIADGKYKNLGTTTFLAKYKNNEFKVWAEPVGAAIDVYDISNSTGSLFQALGNNTLPANAQYANTTYFEGFYGSDAESMSYNVVYEASADSCDGYINTDISAYDENVGAIVTYSNEQSHIANSYSSSGRAVKFTAILNNLPKEWFDEDGVDNIIVRSYIDHSQNFVVYYGYDIADNIVLDGEDAAANQGILAQIMDERYFSRDNTTNIPEVVSIWDDQTSTLKPGYILTKKDDGTYKVTYNSTIDESMYAAKVRQTVNGESLRRFYRYCVAYCIYENFTADPAYTTAVNTVDYMESFYKRGLEDKNTYKFSESKYGRKNTGSADTVDVQEIAPAPKIEGIVAGSNAQGQSTYTISWDKYYRDEYSWDKSNLRYSSNDKKYLTAEDLDLYKTWTDYITNAGGYGPSDVNKARRLMNAYFDLYDKAEYRVDLIGTTIDGGEVILDSVYGNDVTKKDLGKLTTLDNGQAPKTMGGIETAYEQWSYTCSFTDTENKWNSYVTLTTRVTRLSAMSTPYTYAGSTYRNYSNNNSSSYDENSVAILPRYAEASLNILQPLNTLTCNVEIQRDDLGNIVTDGVKYKLNWPAISDEKQLKDLGGYLIKVELKTPANVGMVTPNHYYYVTDIRNPEAALDVIGLDESELTADGSVVTCVDGLDLYDGNAGADGATRTLKMDLGDFNSGDVLGISVKAIARAQAQYFKDGGDGIETEMTVEARLDTPLAMALVVDNTTGMDVYDNVSITDADSNVLVGYVDPTTYDTGLSLVYDKALDTQFASKTGIRIYAAIAVYDTAPADSSDSTYVENSESNWNQAAVATLYSKETPLDIGDYNIGAATHITLAREYAGKWLKIALRAVSDTEIDSKWSDQDYAGLTVNYMWIHVPDIYIAPLGIAPLGLPDPSPQIDGLPSEPEPTPEPITPVDSEPEDVPETPQAPLADSPEGNDENL